MSDILTISQLFPRDPLTNKIILTNGNINVNTSAMLANGTSYYAAVVSYIGNSVSLVTNSPVSAIYYSPLTSPIIISSSIAPTNYTISWSPVLNATSYSLQLNVSNIIGINNIFTYNNASQYIQITSNSVTYSNIFNPLYTSLLTNQYYSFTVAAFSSNLNMYGPSSNTLWIICP